MSDPNSPDQPNTPRPTLKLKVAPRKPAKEPAKEVVAPVQPARKSNGSADAHWSDEYKRRMQADMDKLVR